MHQDFIFLPTSEQLDLQLWSKYVYSDCYWLRMETRMRWWMLGLIFVFMCVFVDIWESVYLSMCENGVCGILGFNAFT